MMIYIYIWYICHPQPRYSLPFCLGWCLSHIAKAGNQISISQIDEPFCSSIFLFVSIYFLIMLIYILSPYSFVTASISIYICTCTQKRIVRCVPSVQAQSWFTQPFALFSQACLLRFPFQIMPSTRGNMLSICIAAVSFISYVALKDYTKLSCVLCGSR
jgi:hypothetical protein